MLTMGGLGEIVFAIACFIKKLQMKKTTIDITPEITNTM